MWALALSMVTAVLLGLAIRVGAILPREPVTLTGDLTIPRDGLWLALIVILLGAALWGFSRFSRFGLVTRAAAENENGVILLGYSPTRLAAMSIVLASLVSGLIAILASPMIQLDSGVFTFGFLIAAIGAALIGRFRRIGPTVATGLAIGMVQSVFTKLQVDLSWFPQYGAREGLPFLVIIVAMVLLGERLPERGEVDHWKLPAVPPANVSARSVVIPVVAAVAGLLLLGPLWRGAIMTTIIAAVRALSFVVLTGFGGQTSLAQMAFAGVAGFALSKLAIQWNIPFPIAPLLAAIVAAGFGALVGLPALRLRGTNLAIATLAGGVAIAEFIFKNPKYVGDASTGGAQIPPPEFRRLGPGAGPRQRVIATGVRDLPRHGRARARTAGRQPPAQRNRPADPGDAFQRARRERGRDQRRPGQVAGLRGVGVHRRCRRDAHRLPVRRGVDLSFGTVASLTALAVAYLGGITSVSGAVTSGIVAASGVAFFGTSQIIGSLGTWEAFIGGLLLIITAILNPEGIAGAFRAQAAEAREKRALRRPARRPVVDAAQIPEPVR